MSSCYYDGKIRYAHNGLERAKVYGPTVPNPVTVEDFISRGYPERYAKKYAEIVREWVELEDAGVVSLVVSPDPEPWLALDDGCYTTAEEKEEAVRVIELDGCHMLETFYVHGHREVLVEAIGLCESYVPLEYALGFMAATLDQGRKSGAFERFYLQKWLDHVSASAN